MQLILIAGNSVSSQRIRTSNYSEEWAALTSIEHWLQTAGPCVSISVLGDLSGFWMAEDHIK